MRLDTFFGVPNTPLYPEKALPLYPFGVRGEKDSGYYPGVPRKDLYPDTPIPRKGTGYYPLQGIREKSRRDTRLFGKRYGVVSLRGIGVQVFSFTEKKPFPYPFGVQRKGYRETFLVRDYEKT